MKRNLKEYPYDSYGYTEIRVINDTDCACEADDAFAVAHVLLTSQFDVRAVTAEHFREDNSAERSYQAICNLVDAMGMTGTVQVLHGCSAMRSETDYDVSEASNFIVEEALRDDPRPLYVVCMGALTNLAVALQTNPAISSKIHCIWIGGGAYPVGSYEYNLCNDIHASRIVFRSRVKLWQVPVNVYSMMRISFMTLYKNLHNCGRAGAYLLKQLFEFNYAVYKCRIGEADLGEIEQTDNVEERDELDFVFSTFGKGESWQLGDSPIVGLLLNPHAYERDIIGAPLLHDDGTYELQPENPRKIVVYKSIDSWFIFHDFFDKMQFQYSDNEGKA